jgi:hypothetical protein
MPRAARTLVLSLLVWLAAATLPAASLGSAGLVGLPGWSAPKLIDRSAGPNTAGFNGLSCPSASLCVAVNGSGEVLTTTSPAVVSSWQAVRLPARQLAAVSCPSVRLCVVVGGGHELFVSTRPTGPAAAWMTVELNRGSQITAVSCASPHLCVVVEQNGLAYSSTDPARGVPAWHRERVVHQGLGDVLGHVSCPTVHLCVALDSGANAILTTSDPQKPAGRWRKHIVGDSDFDAVSCPSARLCVVLGYSGAVYTSTTPATGRWHQTPGAAPGSGGSIACPSTNLCAVVRSTSFNRGPGSEFVSTDPTGGPKTWHRVHVPHGSTSDLACPSLILCIAVTGQGLVLTTRDPVRGPWLSYPGEGGAALTGVTCPTISFCVAVDEVGDVLTSDDPAGGATAWPQNRIDPHGFTAISCPTTTLCTAIDSYGGVLTSTDPAGGPSAWHRAQLGDYYLDELLSVDCPSSSLCLVGTYGGKLFTSTDPTGGVGAWSEAEIEPSSAGHYAPRLDSVSCASTAACLVVDSEGGLLSSVNPTGGPSAWHRTASGFGSLTRASCPSTQLCLATDEQLYYSTDPWANAPSWQSQPVSGTGVSALDCSSTTLCVAFEPGNGSPGQLVASTNPGAGQAWQADGTDPLGAVSGISCLPNSATCVAVDNRGNVLTSR